MFQTTVSVYFNGQDDKLERLPLRPEVKKAQLSLVMPERKLIQLRDYQEETTKNALADLMWHRSSLIVLATGLGKTILFCKLAEQHEGRVLVLAHLEELLQNARDDLMAITGEPVGIERARDHHEGERIVVGLIQSVSRRLKHFSPDHFSLIIVDEAHHAASDAYRRVFDHFPKAKVVGLTATDSRADGEPLPFDTCSYRMGIREGVEEGYLVPINGRRVILEAINLSLVKRKNGGEGDFDESALDDEMVKGANAIADYIAKNHPEDKGILFFPGCASARFTAELLNQRMPDSCVYIDGEIVGNERRELVNALRGGKARWLCNVGIATEGFNWPEASIVGMCSPTLSKPAYVQRAGRGTRPLAGLLNGLSTSSGRKDAIAGSAKPSMLILDFQGVSASVDLVSHESFLDDKPKPKKEAEETFLTEEDEKMLEEWAEEENASFIDGPNLNLRSLASNIKSNSSHFTEDFNPFEAGGDRGEQMKLSSDLGKEPPISHKQYRALLRFGIDDESLTRAEAQVMVSYAASLGWRLWAPQIGILKKLYREVLEKRAVARATKESFV